MLPPTYRIYLFVVAGILVGIPIFGQSKSGYQLLDKPLTSLLPVMPSAPQPAAFEKYSNNQFFRSSSGSNFPGSSAIDQQNLKILQQSTASNARQVEAMADVERDLMLMDSYRLEIEARNKGQSYRQAFAALSALNPDSFSLTKAVYIVENAYFDGRLLEQTYLLELRKRCELVRSILKNENLNVNDNVAVNYAIQKLFSSAAVSNSAIRISAPFRYDFDDFRGEKDYSKMFVTKALATGTGQCHSLPLVYLIIAEQLGTRASLALAPQHSFIQFIDRNGRNVNFEATSGHVVSTSWIMQSGYITSVALQKKTFLSALSHRQLYSQMLIDLLLGYLSKFPHDNFSEAIRKKALQVNPNNLSALIVDANLKTIEAKQKVFAAGKPKEVDLQRHPEALQAVRQMQAAYERVEETGYQDMPEDAYKIWLTSIEREKAKQLLNNRSTLSPKAATAIKRK